MYMLPELFSIGPVTIYSYGLMIAIGIIVAITLAERQALKRNIAPDGFVTSMAICAIVGGFIGSKILYWITILPDIIKDPSIMLNFGNGWVVYGGLIGGILTAYVYCHVKNVDFWAMFDIAAPVIALAQCFGRIGCFLAGCCYGQETDSICGIVFHNSMHAPNGVSLFPIQLVSSGLDLLNFVFLTWLLMKGRFAKWNLKKGMIGIAYIITYSVGRFVLEYFRGDLERGAVGVLSTSQFISIFTVIVGIVLLFVFARKNKENIEK